MSKMTPQIRFQGFTDDWEERKLKELGDIQTGNTPPTSDSDNYSLDGVLWVTPTDIKSLVISNTAKKLSQVGVTKARIAKAGSILVTSIASIGKNTLLRMDAGFNQQINSLTPTSENDSYFLLTQSEKWSEKMKQTAASATMQIVNKTEFSNISTYVPVHKEEQEKIGSFFKQLDDTIALHQRKLDLLKEQKKGYLQKIFPKNGAKVPELRFAGFADDWEERKLSGIIEKLSGGASIKPTDYLEDGIRTIPKGAVNATGIADLSGSKYISEDFFEKNITSHAHTSNLVTSLRDLVPSAPNMGRIVRIEGDDEQFLMPQGVYKLELFEGMDEDFLISFSNSDKYRKIISAEKNGSTQVHIRNGEFLNIDINLPSEHEQKKIGSFFKQLDNSIALHQRKLDLLKEQKKGFLQKMFVS
ncbi:MAG: restriction endonuclease subunit S [Leuconostoc mesenteroides]|jgi:type I restriction enzyme S subunit|nr:restriction endonuclease subunit S [Leuconostoc mesenteroides]MCI1877873.1 restriction endonuclease subunit S [Leuconostoc mesenteroides]MCI1907414.1 restriction endonuclease subunit S [Leuconostoc mesenteroides]